MFMPCFCIVFVQCVYVCVCVSLAQFYSKIAAHQLDVVNVMNDNSDFHSSFWPFYDKFVRAIRYHRLTFVHNEIAFWWNFTVQIHKVQTVCWSKFYRLQQKNKQTICIVGKLLQLNKSSTQKKNTRKGNETKTHIRASKRQDKDREKERSSKIKQSTKKKQITIETVIGNTPCSFRTDLQTITVSLAPL